MPGGGLDSSPVTKMFGNAGQGGGGGFTGKLFNANGFLSPWQIATMDNGEFDPLQLFPANKAGGVNRPGPNLGPDALPASGIAPKFYDPSSFISRPAGNGPFNQMVNKLAGPMYNPTAMNPMGGPSGSGMPPGMPPNPGAPTPGPAPGKPLMIDLMKKRFGGKFGGGY